MSMKNSKDKNAVQNKFYSWPVIIIFLIVFFPIAFFLIYKRYNYDKTNLLKNAKTVKIFGIVVIVIGIFGLLTEISGITTVEGIVIALMLCAGGAWLLFIAKRMTKNGMIYKQYVKAVINQKHTNIDDIAASVGVTYEAALIDLYKMLEYGYFGGSYIDEANRVLTFSNMSYDNVKEVSKAVKCKNCGANNTVFTGRLNVCEYCDSPIEI